MVEKLRSKQGLLTYKALHLGGEVTAESRMMKRMLLADMWAMVMRYLGQAQKNCGPTIEPLD